MSKEDDGILDQLKSKEFEVYLRSAAADVIFQCARCGQCCQGEGYTIVDDQDINRIANGTGVIPENIRETFTISDPENRQGIRIIKMIGPNNLCTFYDAENKRCTIYESRPAICRTHPMMDVLPDPEYGLILYTHCLGASKLVDTLRNEKDNLSVKKYLGRLKRNKTVLKRLKIRLLIHIIQRQGLREKSEEVAQLYGIRLPLDTNDFRKACLAYLLLSIDLNDLDGYKYEGIQI